MKQLLCAAALSALCILPARAETWYFMTGGPARCPTLDVALKALPPAPPGAPPIPVMFGRNTPEYLVMRLMVNGMKVTPHFAVNHGGAVWFAFDMDAGDKNPTQMLVTDNIDGCMVVRGVTTNDDAAADIDSGKDPDPKPVAEAIASRINSTLCADNKCPRTILPTEQK